MANDELQINLVAPLPRVLLLLFGLVGLGAFHPALAQQVSPKWPELGAISAGRNNLQVGPARQCHWIYVGLESFRNAASDPDFDPAFNPAITVSRRGLTARVVGTFSDGFMARYGYSMDEVVRKHPWVIPVAQTAVHRSVAEDGRLPPAQRVQRGQIVSTQVVDLPPNSVMIVYPVSVADRARGFNTLAGNWQIDVKSRSKPSNRLGAFGQFPFLLYTGINGHALHGPITVDELTEKWALRRGEVSHGCNRMEGEHVTELAVLLGCPADPRHGGCAPTGGARGVERVVVIEEFDHIPRPDRRVAAGYESSWETLRREWVAVDVDYPREKAIPAELVAPVSTGPAVYLRATQIERSQSATGVPALPLVQFPTWDNRDYRLVRGEGCR